MARQIKKEEDLKHLVSLTKQHLPDSITVYTVLDHLTKGRFTYYKTFVDDWPNTSIIAIVPDQTVSKNHYINKRLFLYGDDAHKLNDLIHHPDVIDWTSEYYLYGITATQWNALKNSLQCKIKDKCLKPFGYRMQTYMYYLKSPKLIKEVPIPDGFKSGPMTEEALSVAVKRWGRYYEDGFEEYFRELLSHDVPTVCLFDKNNTPVGWVLQQFSGEIGVFYVEPYYRNRGCGKFLLSKILKLICQRYGFAYSYISTDTKYNLSCRLHEFVGMEKQEEIYYRQRVGNNKLTDLQH